MDDGAMGVIILLLNLMLLFPIMSFPCALAVTMATVAHSTIIHVLFI